MSSIVIAKKSMVIVSFALFSLIFLGVIFALETSTSFDEKEHATYLSWIVIAYSCGFVHDCFAMYPALSCS